MSNITKWLFRSAVLIFVLTQFGCSATPPPKDPQILWPGPPATPRLKWVNTIRSQHDFKKTPATVRMEAFVGLETPNFFIKPVAVAADGQGQVFVADMDLHNVKVVDFNQKEIFVFQKEPWTRVLIGLAYDSRGRLYAVDGAARFVSVFDAKTRKPLLGFGSKELFEKPAYIAINEELGRIYVTDVVGHKVVVFDMKGNHLFSFGERGGALGKLYAPMGIAIAPNGDVFVAEFLNARIHVFDQDGTPVRMFGERGDKEWQLEGPRGLAFTSDGLLVIAESRKSAVALYTQEGEPLLFLGGKRSTHFLGFTLPTSVYVDQNDVIYVSDGMNKAVTIWQYLSPKYLEKHAVSDPIDLGKALQK